MQSLEKDILQDTLQRERTEISLHWINDGTDVDVYGFVNAGCWSLCPHLDTHYITKVTYNLQFIKFTLVSGSLYPPENYIQIRCLDVANIDPICFLKYVNIMCRYNPVKK